MTTGETLTQQISNNGYVSYLIGALVLIILYVILGYNKLVRLKNYVDNAWADVDVQLKNRFNLVDNLVNTVKGYAKHEREVFEKVTQARTSFMNAKDTGDKIQADNMMTSTLKSLFAVAENYPDLKANQNFLQLQNELSDLENKIAAARRYYNSAVREYNTAIKVFPLNLVAKLTGFKKNKNYFTLENEAERAVPKVNF